MGSLDDTNRRIFSYFRNELFTNNENNSVPKVLAACKKDSLKKLETDITNFMSAQKFSTSNVEYASVNKMLAISSLMGGKVVKGTSHLTETHANSLRHQVILRFTKTKVRNKYLSKPLLYGLDPIYFKSDLKDPSNSKNLKEMLADLPPEWYVVQVTVQQENFDDYKYNEYAGNSLYTLRSTHPIHISILPTGPNAIEPFCLTLPRPVTNNSYDLRKEIESILNKNKVELSTKYNNRKLYWQMRNRQDSEMKSAVIELENTWLREWRILFIADSLENLELVKSVHTIIDKLIDDSSYSKEISLSTRWLLRKVAECASYLSKEECARAIKYLLPGKSKLIKNIMLSIQAMMSQIKEISLTKKKNLILILDENLDYIPFEAMQVLKHQPVTRFPSIHVAYALFMKHRNSIVNGCKVVEISKKMGSFIVNPSCDLQKMEKRLRVFIDFWLSDWQGFYNKKPVEKEFENALIDYDILMYAGHGNGIQYLQVEEIERLQVKATVLLFGCNSLKLTPVGGRQPPFGVSNQYLTACSPCNLGMLWEVTDGDCDKLTASFMSNWIPSKQKLPWSSVNLTEWDAGKLVFNQNSEESKPIEFEMLRAIAKSKDICVQFMTAAATIVRGLPIMIKQV